MVFSPYALNILRYILLNIVIRKFTDKIHRKMILRTMHADLNGFFNKNDQGLILNRFATDQFKIDDSMFYNFDIFVSLVAILCVEVYLAIKSISIYVIIIYIIYYILVFYLHHVYISFSKDIQRLDYNTRTPIF